MQTVFSLVSPWSLPNVWVPRLRRRYGWTESLLSNYAQRSGITLSPTSSGGSGSGGGDVAMNSEEFLKVQTEQYQFAV